MAVAAPKKGHCRAAAARLGEPLDAAGRRRGTLRLRAAAPAPCSTCTWGETACTLVVGKHGAAYIILGCCSGQPRTALHACSGVQALVVHACGRLSWSWHAEGGRCLTFAEACLLGDDAARAVRRGQAQEFDDDEDEEGDDGEYEGDDSEDEGDDGEEVQLMYEEEADDAGPIEGAWGGEFVEDGDVGEARAALLGVSQGCWCTDAKGSSERGDGDT